MDTKPTESSGSAFVRLLGYARPYRGRLAIGILAGLLVGGSLYGMLANLKGLLRPLESDMGATPSAAVQKAGTTAKPAAAPSLGGAGEFLARYGIPTTTPDGRMSWQLLVLSVIGLPLCVGLRAIGTFANRYYMRWVGLRVVADLRNRLFEHLQSQSLAFFGRSDVGRLISRITNDATLVQNLVAGTVSDATRAPFEIASALLFIVIFAHRNGLLPLLLTVGLAFPLCIIPIIVLGRRVKRHTGEALGRISVVTSRMHETFTGIRVVKAFDMEAAEARQFSSMNNHYFRSSVAALKSELMMTPLMEAVAILLGMIFMVICYVRGVRLSLLVPVVVACVIAYKPIKRMARVNANLQRAGAALARMFAQLDRDTRLAVSPTPVVLEDFRDTIVFDNVSFHYDADSGNALSDINLTIRKGDVVALVGETGSGKTTLANLLARFYDPTEGTVSIDGTNLRNVDVHALRRLIGVVTQETVLFNDTIAANIAYGSPDATRQQIEEAARQANAHRFIENDPKGYERVVGEKGFVLSGGERQRIAIARAILRNPPILILDEATSALDTVTERLVQEAISHVMAHRTVFAIAHRLSTIRHASQICLLANGRIAERGTHEELYAAGGGYRALCDLQLSG